MIQRRRVWPMATFGRRDQRGRSRPMNGSSGSVVDFTQGTLGGLVTFTRAAVTGSGGTGATYIDSAGNFQLVNTDVPRFNCAFGGGAVRGLLIEAESVNIQPRCTWVGGTLPTNWGALFGTGSRAVVTSLYGSADGAVAIQFTGSAQRPAIYYSAGDPSIAGSNAFYMASIVVESISSGSVTNLNLLIPNPTGGGVIDSITYWRGGVEVSSGTDATTGILGCRFRCTTAGNLQMRIGPGSSGAATVVCALSRPMVALCEADSNAPGSWIPTASFAAVTRPADFAYVPLGKMPLTGAVGTVVVGYYRGEGTSTRTPLSILSAVANLVSVGRHAASSTTHTAFDETLTISRTGQAGLNRAAYTWGGVGTFQAALSVNGGAAAGDNLAFPTSMTQVRLGAHRSGEELGAEIAYFAAYEGRTSDAALAVLST